MNGDSPPTMIPVVVLYTAVCGSMCIASARRLRLGLMSAALYGPKKAMTPTCMRTAHFNHEGQFCKGSVCQSEYTMVGRRAATAIGKRKVSTDQWIIFEATRLRHKRKAMGIALDLGGIAAEIIVVS
jgi:hypothetical protein